MLRILAAVLSSALLSVSLFAAVCQPPPANHCTATAACRISVKWFQVNQNCTEPTVLHSEISVDKDGILEVTADSTVGDFKVLQFKKHSGSPCNWKGPYTLATPFVDDRPNQFYSAHKLTASLPNSDGCYTVNFKLKNKKKKIDPHIIVSGTGFVSPTAQ